MKFFTILLLLFFSPFQAAYSAPQSRVLAMGGDSSVSSASFSQDGRFLVALTQKYVRVGDGFQLRRTVRVFDAKSGASLASWPLRTLTAFAISPDNKSLATITGERQRRGVGAPFSVELRDLKTGILRRTFVKAGSVKAAFYVLAWSPDGKFLAADAGNGRVLIWNTQTGTEVGVLPVGGFVTALAWSPRQDLLATGNGKEVGLWNWAKQQRVAVSDNSTNEEVISIQFSPDSRHLLVNSESMKMRLLQVPLLSPLTGRGFALADFSRDGKQVAFWRSFYDKADLLVMDAEMKREEFNLRVVNWQVKALNLGSDHQLRWASVSGDNDLDQNTFKLWQTSAN